MERFSYISDTELAFSKWSSHSVIIATIIQSTESVFQGETGAAPSPRPTWRGASPELAQQFEGRFKCSTYRTVTPTLGDSRNTVSNY